MVTFLVIEQEFTVFSEFSKSELSWQVLIEGSLNKINQLLFVHQLTFGLKSIEHDYIITDSNETNLTKEGRIKGKLKYMLF